MDNFEFSLLMHAGTSDSSKENIRSFRTNWANKEKEPPKERKSTISNLIKSSFIIQSIKCQLLNRLYFKTRHQYMILKQAQAKITVTFSRFQ